MKLSRFILQVLSKETPRENIVVSPLSIKLLLALILEGSGGQTNNEILHALHLPSDNEAASNILKKLRSLIPTQVRIFVYTNSGKLKMMYKIFFQYAV